MSSHATSVSYLPYDKIIKTSGTAAQDKTTEINQALAQAATYTRPYGVALKGNFSQSATFPIQDYTYFNCRAAKITATADISMITCANAATHGRNIVVDGGIWNADGVASKILYWTSANDAAGDEPKIAFMHMTLLKAKTLAFHVVPAGAQGYYVHDIELRDMGAATDDGMHCEVADSVFSDIRPSTVASKNALEIIGGMNVIKNLMTDGGSVSIHGHSNELSNFTIDTQGANNGLVLGGSRNQISNGKIRCYGSAAQHANYAIQLWASGSFGGTKENTLDNINCGDSYPGIGATNLWHAGILDAVNVDRNTYRGINAYDAENEWALAGANNHVSQCWNKTTWVA